MKYRKAAIIAVLSLLIGFVLDLIVAAAGTADPLPGQSFGSTNITHSYLEKRGWPTRSVVYFRSIGDRTVIRVVHDWFHTLINLTLFASAVALLSFGVRHVYQRLRRKIGHCPRCNYNLRGTEHEACPVCGEEVSKGQLRIKSLQAILLFLLLGTMANMAFAWGVTLVSKPNNEQKLVPAEIRAFMAEQTIVDWRQHNVISALRFKSVGREQVEFRDGSPPELSDDANSREIAQYNIALGTWSLNQPFLYQDLAGWPLYCFHAWTAGTSTGYGTVSHGLEYGDRIIPIGILVPHFIVNSIVWTILAWLSLLVVIELRATVRHRRDLCMKCAYDLRGVDHQACPECGEEIRKGNPA